MSSEEKKNGGRRLIRDDLISGRFSGASNLVFNQQIKQWIKEGRKVFHFGFGQSPFPVMEEAVRALQDNAAINEYLPVQGLPELREQICAFHSKYDNLTCDPNQIVLGPGSKELIFLLMNIFKGTILLMSPSWTTFKPQSLLSHHDPVVISVNASCDWKLTPAILEQTIQSSGRKGPFLLVLNNPCNPTGTVYSTKDFVELSAMFRKYDVIVLSDEIYARLRYDHQHVSLATVYPEGTILSTGFSKWASVGGWRLGYNVYPKELTAVMEAVKSAGTQTYTCAPAPIQYAAIRMLKNAALCDDYIQHTTRIMQKVAQYCHSSLSAVGVKVMEPKGGYYMLPDFEIIREPLRQRGVTTCEMMCSLMLTECSVAVMAAGPFFLRPVDELTTRLCFVDFDGAKALSHSRQLGLATPLPDEFVRLHCTGVYDGIAALTKWVSSMQSEMKME